MYVCAPRAGRHEQQKAIDRTIEGAVREVQADVHREIGQFNNKLQQVQQHLEDILRAEVKLRLKGR